MPGEGDDDFNLGDEFDEENFDPNAQDDPNLGDDADDGGEGGIGVHPSQPAEDGGLGGEPSQQVRTPSRGQLRVEAATREAREAREAAARAQQELRDYQASQSRANSEAREAERLAQMEPWERAEYLARQSAQASEQRFNQLQQQMIDQNDRATFAAACVSDPRLARVKDEVEQTLDAHRRQTGQTLPREVVAAFIIGQRVLKNAPSARAKQAKTAAARVAREQGRPVSGGSDARGGRVKDDRAARLARLSDAAI